MSQSTEKSLGQVARQAYYGRDYWESVGTNSKEKWEEVAQAVAAAVREKCAQACEQRQPASDGPLRLVERSFGEMFAKLIRSMK